MLTELQPFQLVERNLRHALEFYAGSNELGQVRTFPGVQAISCGRDYPVFNSALLTAPVPGPEGALSSRVYTPAIFFRAIKMGWSFWICHDLLDAESISQLRETCRSFRMDQVLTAPGMYATKLEKPLRAAPPLVVREVDDAPTRTVFAHLVAVIFDLPFQMTMNIYGQSGSWTDRYSAYIGYAEDKPVTMAMVNVTDGCCGFYSVGTMPGHRRRGYAEALMRAAFERIERRTRCESCVLQSSTAGRRLYEKMGFREVTQFSVFRSVSH